MELLSILLVYLVTVAFLVWVCVLSDPNSNSLGGKLNILLTEELPGLLTSKLQRRLPPRLYDGLAHSYDWVVNRRNPLLQLLYLFLFLGSFAVYVYEGWGRMAPQDIAFSLALVVLCLSSFTVACFVRAGTITAGSWWRFDNYAPDGIIYEAGKECSTCKVPKLARSKHCRLCGVCQSRFDHHCGWLNQCVGELNYKHFLFFLALHSATFFYGSSRIWGVLGKEIREKQLWEATFYSPSSGRTVSASPTVVLQYLVVHEGALCGVLALCTVMAVVLLGFWLYHLSLVFRNTTTNETFKWSAVRAQAKQARSQAQRAHEASGGALPLRQIRDPVNSYNISLLANVKEVLFPRSERPGAGAAAGGREAAAATRETKAAPSTSPKKKDE